MIYVILGMYFIFAFSSPIIVMRLVRRHNVKSGRVKSKEACKCKAQATITKTYDSGMISDLSGRGKKTHAHYEFYVDGIKYNGVGEIYGNPFNNQTVTVLYDPNDPSNNCTQFGKGQQNGRNYLIALAIVIGGIIIVYLTMFLFFWLGTVR